jgi:hypothetical protein
MKAAIESENFNVLVMIVFPSFSDPEGSVGANKPRAAKKG